MMGSGAFLMPVSGVRFVRIERIDLRMVLGLAIGGIPALLLMAYGPRRKPARLVRAQRCTPASQRRYEARADSLVHGVRIPERLYTELLALRDDPEG